MKLATEIAALRHRMAYLVKDLDDTAFYAGPDVDPAGTAASKRELALLRSIIERLEKVTEI